MQNLPPNSLRKILLLITAVFWGDYHTISHTDTTWATDVSNIIKSHAESIIEKPSVFSTKFRFYFDDFLRWGSVLLFCVLVVFWAFYARDVILGSGVNEALYFIAASTAVFAVFSLITKLIVQTVTIHISLMKSSFICFVDKDFKYRERVIRKESRSYLFYLLGVAVNVASGILASVIFTSIS